MLSRLSRLGLWFAVVFLAVSGGAVAETATAAPPTGAASGGSAWDEPAMQWPGRELFEGPQFRRSLAEAARRGDAAAARRESREARDERVRSRSAFASLGRTGALELARQQFPALLVAGRDLLRLRAGERVTGFPARNVATIVDARGKRSMLISDEPVAAGQGDDLRRMDLTLRRSDEGFAPAAAAVDVTVPTRSDGFLTLERTGLGMRPAEAAPVTASVSDSRAFYPDIAADTDYLATPTRAGAEVMWQLRSDDAPEQLGLDVDVPVGATMRIASELTAFSRSASVGDVEIVRDGEVLNTITAPIAIDSDGTSVPAAFRFDGHRLVVDVAHRGRDLRYPILVDPEVRDVWGAYDFNGSCGGGPTNFLPGRWTYGQTASFTGFCGDVYGSGIGLFLRSEAIYYNDGATAYWMWGAPSGSYIADAWFDGLRHAAAGTYVYTGLTGSGAWGSLVFHPSEFFYGQYSQVPDSPFRSWAAVVGLSISGSYGRPHIGLGGVRGVNLRLSDLDPPAVRLTGITGGLNAQAETPWSNDLRTYNQATVNAIDGGLGIHELAVVRDGTGAVIGSTRYGCAGHRSSPCPRDWTATFPLYLSQLPEGRNAIQTRAIDIVGNGQSGPHWIQRIDRSAPDIDISGELVEHSTDGLLSANPRIDVHATDGSTAGPLTQRSGVRAVRLYVNGELKRQYAAPEATCDNCDRGLSWWIPESELAGDTTVRLEATDYLGHTASRWFTVITYPTSRTYGGPNQLIDTQSEVDGLASAMASGSDGDRWVKWAGTDPTSRANYVNALLPDAMRNRAAFGMTSDEPSVRVVFADASAHRTIRSYGAPMTSSEYAVFSTDAHPGPFDDHPIATSSSNRPGDELPVSGELDGPDGMDSTTGYGCEPATEPNCSNDQAFSETLPLSTFSFAGLQAQMGPAVAAASSGTIFNRPGAVADANAHAASGTGRDGLFGRLPNDCTNFVSQVWSIGGGLNMTSKWYMRSYMGIERRWTASWGATRNFVDYMVNTRRVARLATVFPSSRRLPLGTGLGDAIEYDWGTGHGWSHLAVVVDLQSEVSKISQHSIDRRESSWRRGYMKAPNAEVRANMRTRIVAVRSAL